MNSVSWIEVAPPLLALLVLTFGLILIFLQVARKSQEAEMNDSRTGIFSLRWIFFVLFLIIFGAISYYSISANFSKQVDHTREGGSVIIGGDTNSIVIGE